MQLVQVEGSLSCYLLRSPPNPGLAKENCSINREHFAIVTCCLTIVRIWKSQSGAAITKHHSLPLVCFDILTLLKIPYHPLLKKEPESPS